MKKIFLFFLLSLISFNISFAQSQYNSNKGQNVIYELKEVQLTETVDDAGKKVPARKVKVRKKVAADKFGNANGNQYDLAVDGAFKGNTIAVLHLYTGEGFDFSLPKAALKEKGFSVYRWIDNPPSAEELKKALEKSCQLWIISSHTRKLNTQHLQVIKEFFESGKGIYIWGDNQPFYADANFVAEGIFGVSMLGNTSGDQVVGLQSDSLQTKTGLLPKHLITTGLAYVYEGITIATIQDPDASKLQITSAGNTNQINKSAFKPLIYGSAGNLVATVYEESGKRAIIDGGFTRLFLKWDTAGTGRYVKNAAAWLVNIERFEAKK